MRWTQRLAADVYQGTRNHGSRYFKSGAVEIESGSSGKVKATVLGSSRYSIDIRLEGNEVVAFCDCPAFQGGNLCKHIWAVLLAAEAEGHLSRIASAWEPSLEHGLEYDLPDDDGAFDFVEPGPNEGFRKPDVRAPRPQPPKVPEWKLHLSALRNTAARAPSTEPQRRIYYVVDIAECLSAGGLIVQAAVSRLKTKGDWGKPNFQETWIREVSQFDAVDRRVLAVLSGITDSYGYYGPGHDSAPSRRKLPAASLEVLLPLLSATSRFFVRVSQQAEELLPIHWDDGEPWTFRISVALGNDTAQYVINGDLQRSDDRKALSEPLLLTPGAAVFSDRIARFDDANAFEWVSFLRRNGSLAVPAADLSALRAEIAGFSSLPPMELPSELRMEAGTLARPPYLKIRAVKGTYRPNDQKLRCELEFDYDGVRVPETHAASAIHDPGADRYLLRDRKAEEQASQRLATLGARRSTDWRAKDWELAPTRLPALVHTLVSEGWRVEADGALYRRAGGFKIDVTSGIDWFELSGEAEFEGQAVALPELLKAVARGEKMVRLGDGSFGLLPEAWLDRYRLVAGFAKDGDGHLRFKRSQAGLLDALLQTQPEVTFDEGFLRVRHELETFAGVQASDAPQTFKGRLRDYQREGLGWLLFLRRFGFGGCLADDMGLGKTIQVLALLDTGERKGPALVVVPRSLVFNWKQEAAKFAPRLRLLDLTGPGRKDQWERIPDHDVVIATYGTLRRDAPILTGIRFDTIILDEAQAIKNASTESAKAARLLSADHRLTLTGTPVENRLGDLWSLFEFLNPGLLGSASIFRTTTGTAPSGESTEILSKALRPFLLRRTKEQVAKELPAKMEQTIYCELEVGQRKLYNELRQHYRASLLGQIERVGIQKSRMQILEALLRLRQAACHPGLIDKNRASEASSKLESLIPQLQEVTEEGHKALVFSQFTSLLAIVRHRLEEEKIAYEYLDGRTRDREARVRRFQEDATCPLFLISLKAGGLGLNLTAAEYVFLLDPWWNPATEAQAIDRAHRIGQSRRVFAYRLIARDTVEEKVLELQKSKRDLADSIIGAENSALAGMDRETLELLLS